MSDAGGFGTDVIMAQAIKEHDKHERRAAQISVAEGALRLDVPLSELLDALDLWKVER